MAAQTVVHQGPSGRVMAMDSAYDVAAANRDVDVVVNSSYCGALPARFVGQHRPRGAIGMDCAIGKDGAGIAGLWYLEALGIPAATADVMSAELGNGVDLFERGVISRSNAVAAAMGVVPGMPVRDASLVLLTAPIPTVSPEGVTNRRVMLTGDGGRAVVCTDSIAFGLPEDRGTNVLCTAGHTGRSAVPYLLDVMPLGFVCSDGGRGRNDSGVAGLALVVEHGLAGATVDARTARMGDGVSTYEDGVISACNTLAAALGVEVGQPAAEAASRLLQAQTSR